MPIKTVLFVISVVPISSKSVQLFLRERVTNIHLSLQTRIYNISSSSSETEIAKKYLNVKGTLHLCSFKPPKCGEQWPSEIIGVPAVSKLSRSVDKLGNFG